MQLNKIVFILFIVLSMNSNAQSGIGSAKSLIKIEFEDVFGLKISETDITLDINSVEKFTSGTQTNWLNSHLIITGIKNFEISVKAVQPYFFNNNIETDVTVNNIKINAKNSNSTNTIYLSDVTQKLISERSGSLINYIDVKYEIPPDKTKAFFNNSTNIFETLIVYTLIPN